MSVECPECHAKNPETVKFCGECGAPLEAEALHTRTLATPQEELTTGSTFAGRYQIIEELGKGGMGRVYKVLDRKINEKIALKLIKPEIASDKKIIERFSNELKTARRVGHRNVGRMFDINEEKGTHFITMEYVAGQDLKGLIRQTGRLAVPTAVSIAKQICEGLAEAHRLGIIHRDLKPSNIMIDKSGQARIMDFGIARTVIGKGITAAGVMIGTPEYMSPEQVEAKDIDRRTDIYSLGIILYEMLAGRVPFEGDTAMAVGIKHRTEAPEDPKVYNPRIPDSLSRMILCCLEKDRDKRYQGAEEVRSELERIEDDLPTTAQAVPHKKPITSKEITVSFSPKKIWIPALLIFAILAVGFGIRQIFFKKGPASDMAGKRSIAVLPFEDRSPQQDQAPICDQMMIEINRKLNLLGSFDVRSRFWVKPLVDSGKDPGTIGRELGVAAILVGSIQSDKENLGMDVELLRVGDKKTLWAHNYRGKADEIFSIQNEVVQQISNAMGLTLSPEENALLSRKPTDNPEAYKLYALGRWFYDKRTSDGFQKAIENYRKAIALDPGYALAYSGLADVYIFESTDRESAAKAREAALKALELDDELAEAYTSRANVRLEVDWNYKGAEEDFKKALELDPHYASAHHWYSRLLTMLGRHESAIAEMERALELNPTDLSINRNFVMALLCARQFDRALTQAQKTYGMDPDFNQVKEVLFLALVEKSMFQEILELYGSDEDSGFVSAAKLLLHAENNREEAVKMFKDMAGMLPGVDAAWFYARLGEADKVFQHLERSYKNRFYRMTFLKVMPGFDEYYSDPRFLALLKKMGLD